MIGRLSQEWWIDSVSHPFLEQAGVQAVGVAEPGIDYHNFRPRPEFAHWHIVLEGRAELLLGDVWKTKHAGEAIFFPSGKPHGSRVITRGKWRFGWVVLSPGLRPGSRVYGEYQVDVNMFAALFASLELLKDTSNAADAIYHQVMALLQSLKNFCEKPPSDPRLDRAFQRFAQDLTRSWTREEMASVACLGSTQFWRLCREHYGISPAEKLRRLRMDAAIRLMGDRKLTLSEIAERCGYPDYFVFSKIFKRTTRFTPTAFRNSLLGRLPH
jgi:AraC-like DNA-binding protein